MQITGKPSARSSCQSQVVVGPVSRPMRFALTAFALMNSAIAAGSEFTVPSNTISPTAPALANCRASLGAGAVG